MESATFTALELTDNNVDQFGQQNTNITTASQWFCCHFPDQAKQYGAPFLENRTSTVDGLSLTSPIAPNIDFMAACLGGDKRLGHSIIYWPGECQFYYLEPMEKIYYPTQDTKLGDLMRGLFAKCALEVQKDVNVYYLFTTFRTDAVVKLIVERAKSILRAAEDYFSATSPHERRNGIELHERLARLFVEKMLVSKPGEMMLACAAYDRFAALVRKKDLFPIKRSQFKDLVTPIIREKFDCGFRNDLVVENRYQHGWKNIGLNTLIAFE
jgi:hypothetical protein